MIYFDNAATNGHRPEPVVEATTRALRHVSANPGRSGHRRSLEAARLVADTRERMAELLGVADPARIVFTKNGTEAVNLVLMGLLAPGDRVLASSWEHNAVMRPLRWLEQKRDLRLDFIPPAGDSPLDLEWLERRLASERVRLVALLDASNVTGEVMPVSATAALCRLHGVFLLVDAAQGGGVLDHQVERDGVDALALTGHKSLAGPPGTGALYLRDPTAVEPLLHGGTGSRSEAEEMPAFPPDRFEAGTPNVPGLAGLGAAVRLLQERGLADVRKRHRELAAHLLARLRPIPRLRLHGPSDPERQLATQSLTADGLATSDLARELDRRGICCRPGLHCAPRAHRTLGTLPEGTLRFSLSSHNTEAEIDTVADALQEILG